MMKKTSHWNKTTFLLAWISFCAAVFVIFCEPPNEGLSLLFLLPFAFSLSLLFFGKEYAYCKDSFGLKILYASAAVRYVLSPVLIVVGGSTVSTLRAEESDYTYAVFVALFELIVSMAVIRIIWPKHLKKQERIKKESGFDPEHITFRLSWAGLLFVLLLVALIIFRGHWDNIVSHLSTWFNRVVNHEDLYNYDMMAFNIVKTVAFLAVVALMKWVYDKTAFKIIPLIVALAAGVLNTMFFEYSERTDLAVLVITSFFVLSCAFPKYRKPLGVIFGIGGVLLVSAVFMNGSMKYEMGESLTGTDISDFSKMAELYTTGPSVIANAHMNYDFMREQVTLLTYFQDLVRSCDLFSTLPFLRFILNAAAGGKGSVEIFMSSIGGLAYIIPNHSLASLYVGDLFCWFLEPLFITLNIWLLGCFERIRFKINDLAQVYAVYSIVTMVAMGVFCNNIQLMLHSFSSLPLWLLIFSYINNLGNKFSIGNNESKLKRNIHE